MQVTLADRDGWAVVTVAGEMDLISSPAVRQKVHDVVAEGRRSLVLDLGGVRFCDSSGVGVLIGARRLMRSCAGRLRIVLPQGGSENSHRLPGSQDAPSTAAGAVRPPLGEDDDRPAPGHDGEAHVNRVLAALGVRRLFEVYPDLAAATDDMARPLSA